MGANKTNLCQSSLSHPQFGTTIKGEEAINLKKNANGYIGELGGKKGAEGMIILICTVKVKLNLIMLRV